MPLWPADVIPGVCYTNLRITLDTTSPHRPQQPFCETISGAAPGILSFVPLAIIAFTRKRVTFSSLNYSERKVTLSRPCVALPLHRLLLFCQVTLPVSLVFFLLNFGAGEQAFRIHRVRKASRKLVNIIL